MNKKLLIIGQDVKLNFIFEEAKRLGIDVYYVHEGNESILLDDIYAKEVFSLPIFSNPDQAIDDLEKLNTIYKFDGVLTLYDPALSIVARICKHFNFTALDIEFTENCRQKNNIRRILKENNLNTPEYFVFSEVSEIDFESFNNLYPLIVKPSNAFFSHGVCKVSNQEELIKAVREVNDINKNNISKLVYERPQIIIEKFIDGPEFAIESFTVDGEVHVLSIGYKGNCKGPFFEESIYIAPANIPRNVYEDIEDQVKKALIALGIKNGPSHTELRVDQNWKPYLIETAPRIGGSGISHYIVHESTGVNFMELVLKHALGQIDESIIHNKYKENKVAGNYIIPVKGSGIFKEFKNIEVIKKDPQVKQFLEFYENGLEVLPYPNFSGYPGFILTVHDTYQECEDYYRKLDNEIVVEYH